jgi:hypothetical protein
MVLKETSALEAHEILERFFLILPAVEGCRSVESYRNGVEAFLNQAKTELHAEMGNCGLDSFSYHDVTLALRPRMRRTMGTHVGISNIFEMCRSPLPIYYSAVSVSCLGSLLSSFPLTISYT